MIVISIKKLSYHLIWIFGLLEMITVPLVAWLPQISSLQTKSPWQGAVVGFLGVIVLFSILNHTISRLKIRMEGETVTKISILQAALWNTLFLSLIFLIQKIAGLWVIDFWIPRYLFAGFVSVFGAVLITLPVYGWAGRYIPLLRISITTSRYTYLVKKISVMGLALLAGFYEAIALPLILLWQKAESFVPLIAAITGMVGGVVGCSIIVILYNQLNLLQIKIVLEKSSKNLG
jgi:hypothetical protein